MYRVMWSVISSVSEKLGQKLRQVWKRVKKGNSPKGGWCMWPDIGWVSLKLKRLYTAILSVLFIAWLSHTISTIYRRELWLRYACSWPRWNLNFIQRNQLGSKRNELQMSLIKYMSVVKGVCWGKLWKRCMLWGWGSMKTQLRRKYYTHLCERCNRCIWRPKHNRAEFLSRCEVEWQFIEAF